MGVFTWTDATIKNPKADKYGDYKKKDIVEYGGYAKLICPDNTEIETTCHDVYGRIGKFDIYELVAEWNRYELSADNLLKRPDRPTNISGLFDFEKKTLKEEGYSDEEITALDEAERQKSFVAAVKRWENMTALIDEYKTGASDEVLSQKYGEGWKRKLGIAISLDYNNARKLKYPIKLTKESDAHGYDNLYISYSCLQE